MSSATAVPSNRRAGSTYATVPNLKEKRFARLIGWQGFTVRVPDEWDLTGFSGDYDNGYFRIDDGEEMGLEVKWATEPAKAKTPPDVNARRESFLFGLKKAAKKKKLEFSSRDVDNFRPTQRLERRSVGFSWTGDCKAVGALWFCETSRRVVIAQVLGPRTGNAGVGSVADAILSTLENKPADPEYVVWSLYDLYTEVPSAYKLVSQQLMNVYLRLSFLNKTSRLSVEQWSVASVARRDAYLDVWLQANSKAELHEARYVAEETTAHGHPALQLVGGLALGMPVANAVKQLTKMEVPPTRFSALAWECDQTNRIFLVEGLRTTKALDMVGDVAARTICHSANGDGGAA